MLQLIEGVCPPSILKFAPFGRQWISMRKQREFVDISSSKHSAGQSVADSINGIDGIVNDYCVRKGSRLDGATWPPSFACSITSGDLAW